MNNFDELKSLWQSQELADFQKEHFKRNLSELPRKLKKFEKKQFRSNLLKTILSSLILMQSIWFLSGRISSIYTLLGLAIIILSFIIFMIIYWRTQFKLSGKALSNPSKLFLQTTIQKLKKQKQFFKADFPILGISFIIGINFVYAGLLNKMVLADRIYYHLGESLFLFLLIFIGLKIRSSKFKKQYQPLIDELNTILTSLDE